MFTESDTDPDGFFEISGNFRGDGTLKLQTNAGSISFTPGADGKVTVHFIGATSLKVNGVGYDNITEVDGIKTLTFVVKEGTTYEITKGNGEAIVSYIEYVPGDFSDLEDPHTHVYVNGECECGEKDPNYVAPHEHTYVIVVTAPTCTEKGYTTYTCSTCGDVKVDNETAALGHNFVDGVCDRTGCGVTEPIGGDKEVFKYETSGEQIKTGAEMYKGNAFSVTLLGGSVTPTSTTATAADGTEFTACLLPGGSGRSYTITANKSGKIYLYITVTDGSFSSKTATVTYGDNTTNITSQKGVAYKLELDVVAGQTYTITASANRLALFAVVYEQ